MKTGFLAAMLSLALISSTAAAQDRAADSTAFAGAEWNWQPLGKGAQAGSAHIRMFGGDQTVSIVKYPARRFRTSIVAKAGAGCTTTDSLAAECHATAAVNGSYFNVRTLQPCTFLALDHKMVSVTAPNEFFRTNNIVALKGRKGRRMDIMLCDTTRYGFYTRHYRAALASGPLLISGGEIQEFADDRRFSAVRHPRTLIGKDRSGNFYFITIDGRSAGNADGATLDETALIAKWAGIDDAAINLDGGGSTTLWTSSSGVVNHPTDNRKFDHAGTRRVPNIFIIK